MKAVIVEIKNPFAAAMTEDGRIIRLKNKNYAIGEVIEMKKISFSKKTIFAAAGIAAVLAFGCTGIWAYNTPHTYVSLDVNPSIEYELNVFDRVIDYTAVNDDGEAILENLDLNNMDINDAIDQTIQEIASQGYLTDSEPGGIVIAVADGDNEENSQEIADSLGEEAKSAVEEAGVQAEIEAIGIGAQRVAEARALGVTPGKLNLVQKLQASNPNAEISTEEWLKQPVKNIMKAIKENRKNPENTAEPAAETTAAATDETAIAADGTTTESTAETSATIQETQRNKETKRNEEKEMNANSNTNRNKKSEETTAQTTLTETSETTSAPVSETTKKEVPANSNAQKQTEKEVETETEKQNNGNGNQQSNSNNNSNENSSANKNNSGNSGSNSGKGKK
ncbi:MAG: hypothetical protein PWQ76_606 [Clostridiales bacterium]|jgi:hypothetical protein|nr:hypothetical protein [Oscillospiraceae bacterium]MDN5378351.1 hypothetical protein [Clostridiales bacterium]